jgi:hypothetical protein
MGRYGLDSSGSGLGPGVGHFEHGDELSGYIKCRGWTTISVLRRTHLLEVVWIVGLVVLLANQLVSCSLWQRVESVWGCFGSSCLNPKIQRRHCAHILSRFHPLPIYAAYFHKRTMLMLWLHPIVKRDFPINVIYLFVPPPSGINNALSLHLVEAGLINKATFPPHLIRNHATKTYGWSYCFTILRAVGGGEWSAPRCCRFIPGTHCIGGWVGSDRCGKEKNFLPLPGIELLVLRRLARSLVAVPTAVLNQSYFCGRIHRRIERVKGVTWESSRSRRYEYM